MAKNTLLIDLNIILDVLLDRKGSTASLAILELGEDDDYELCVSAHMVTTLAYLLEHAKVPHHVLLEHIQWVLQVFSVIPTQSSLLKKALPSPLRDYEDAVVEQAALACNARIIITRNIKDFTQSKVTVQTPEDYLT